MNQIIARDNELRKAYNSLPADQRTEPYESMVDLVIDWFNERQNPETGHWESTSNYLAVNGILKIMGIYNSAKRAVNYAEEMALAAFDAVTSDEEVTSIVCVYNTWSAILKILNNLRNYAGDVEIDGVMISGKERANKLLATIRESAVEAIAATADKLKIFLKEDGSFSYKPTMSSPTSQGMPVAVTGTNEGDVNATVLATSGTTNSMFTALGLSGFYIQIYGEHELTVFLKTINGLSPVIKDGVAEENEPGVPYGFDDEEIGEAPYGVGTLIREGSTALISSDEKHGKILEVHSAAGVGDYVYVHNDASKNAACYIFEADVNIKKGNGYDVQLTVGSHYMLSMSVSQSKGTVTIAEETHSTGASSVKREIATVNTNEWFNIRVEYYVAGSGDKPMTKVYLNGKLVAVSAAYYGQTVDNKDVKVPSASFEKAKLQVRSASR